MKQRNPLSSACINQPVRWPSSGFRLLPLLLFLSILPLVVQAQFRYTTNNGTITITAYTGPSGAVTIPDTITGLPVTGIGTAAFFGTYATSVAIPASVTNLALEALQGCYWLGSITVDLQNPVLSSLNGVLFNKNQTTLLAYPDSAGSYYTVPNSVTTIGPLAFGWCSRVISITIPNSVTVIGYQAFYE